MENPTQPHVVSQQAEYGDKDTVRKLFDIRPSSLYFLSKSGAIRSVRFKVRTGSRGKRLYDLDSIREFLAAHGAKEVAK